jgi:hypothetical protein
MPVLSAVDISNLLSKYAETCDGKQRLELSKVLLYLHDVIHGPFSESKDARPYTFFVTLVPFVPRSAGKPAAVYYYGALAQDWGTTFTVGKADETQTLTDTLLALGKDLKLDAYQELSDEYGGRLFGIPTGMDLVAVQLKERRADCYVQMAVACRLLKANFELPEKEDCARIAMVPSTLLDTSHPLLMRRAAARIFTQIID